MRKKILLSLVITTIAFGLCSCGNSNKASNSTLDAINENENNEEAEDDIDKLDDLGETVAAMGTGKEDNSFF